MAKEKSQISQKGYNKVLEELREAKTTRREEIAQKIMDVVNSFMDATGEGRTLITDLIAAIKAAVEEKKDEKPKP